MLPRAVLTLGILAGGRASRLGGRDKAWIERDGLPQVLRHARSFETACATVLVSANRDLSRYAEHGLTAVSDRRPDCGPLGGLDALAAACTTPWLFTVSVDLVNADPSLLPALAALDGQGAVASDDDGLQPLVALYPVAALRPALAAALAQGNYSVQALQRGLGMPIRTFAGQRFGNLNTPEDLRMAGCSAD